MRLFFALWIGICFCCGILGEAQETIGIFTYKVYGVAPWDPQSVRSGITGSEEAVIYMSQKLAQLGYKVVVLGNPPANSPHSLPEANPRFIDLNTDDGSFFDIAISWRMPTIGETLKKRAHKVFLWPHDTAHVHLTEAQVHSFDGVLWLSQWQREQWISVNPSFARYPTIFGNGINPEQFQSIQERPNPYSCIYGSNYARGLEILLDIWPTIKAQFPRATLDIYYGWQHWGLLSPDKEAKMRTQVALLAPLGVKERGMVSHEELTKAFEQASFWTYPCIAPETFCITAIRAQLAGGVPVIVEGTALKETVRCGYKCSKAEEYLQTLTTALSKAETITVEERKKMGAFVLKEFTWEALAHQWKEYFDSILIKDSLPKEAAHLNTIPLPQ